VVLPQTDATSSTDQLNELWSITTFLPPVFTPIASSPPPHPAVSHGPGLILRNLITTSFVLTLIGVPELLGWFFIVIPSPGAVCPAMVM
jgi:hypothetical protein